MNSLLELHLAHRGKASDKWSIYLDTYDRIFARLRDQKIALLEIGIQNGGSLEIWSKFFTQASRLVGCDINPACAELHFDDPRIVVVVGDANSDNTDQHIESYSKSFDIVIDDGSHRSSDIIKTFARYFPKLKDGGVFIAEDLHCSYWNEFEGGLHDPYSSIAFFKLLADVVNNEHWGTPQKRSELVQGIAQRYSVRFDDDTLSLVHSIEFVNSVCIIQKKPSINNVLGPRLVAGETASVWPDVKLVANTTSKAFDQQSNRWAVQEKPAGELVIELESAMLNLADQHKRALFNLQKDHERALFNLQKDHERALRERDTHISNLNQAINALYGSTSWRLTGPLRFCAQQTKRIHFIACALPDLSRRSGGILPLLRKTLNVLRKDGFAGIRSRWQTFHTTNASLKSGGKNDYQEWIRQFDTIDDDDRRLIRHTISSWQSLPKFSIVMPTFNANSHWLSSAIDSVRTQLYPNWELCIADDASTDPEIRPLLERYANEDSRIKVCFRSSNGHISAASNSAIEISTGDWMVLLDHDDLLSETALFYVAKALLKQPSLQMLYSDEDKIDESGIRHTPYFKSDWNPDLFYSHNMFSHLGVYKLDLVKFVGGFREGFEGAQDYDLALRCIEQVKPEQIAHIPKVLYHWRAHSSSTASASEAKPYAIIAGQRALTEHFKRLNVSATVSITDVGYQVRYDLPAQPPLVSLLIPTRDRKDLIEVAVNSILDKSLYKNFEIIILDNGSADPETLAWFTQIQLKDSRVKVIRYDYPFNYSAINNFGVSHASGTIIGLINNDIEVISPNWLSEMVSHAMRPEIGCVGAKLYYSNGTIQHGGVVLGAGGVAGHSHKHFPRDANGYFGRLKVISNYSAVTAACLLVRKRLFDEVGGLDENNLKVAFNDVDFCLKVRELGYRNLYSPYAELYHHESVSRGLEDTPEKQARFISEVEFMQLKWGRHLLDDPFYSPNLTLEADDFSLAWPPREFETL